MSIQQLDQSVNRFGTTKAGDFLYNHTSPDGSQLIDDLTPTGTIEITENGEYDVTQYAEADVNVEGITVNESYDISEGKLNTATVTLEGYVTAHIPDGVTEIGNEAFEDNKTIEKVIMPDSVTTIEDGENLGYTVRSPFGDCQKLREVVFSKNLSNIGACMFYNCFVQSGASGVTLEIPRSVTHIGEYAFKAANIAHLVIYNTISDVSANAFAECNATDIYYTGTQVEWEAIEGISSAAIPAGATIHYEYTPE